MYNQELQNGGYSDQNIRENLEIAHWTRYRTRTN